MKRHKYICQTHLVLKIKHREQLNDQKRSLLFYSRLTDIKSFNENFRTVCNWKFDLIRYLSYQ